MAENGEGMAMTETAPMTEPMTMQGRFGPGTSAAAKPAKTRRPASRMKFRSFRVTGFQFRKPSTEAAEAKQ